ncbi:hypothetical protein KIPE111705_07170 [Kibdelosporangium persicum]
MRVERFKDYLREKIIGLPDVASVDTYAVDDAITGIKVTGTDGVELYLHVVRTSPNGGDNHNEPEKIVTKHAVTM